MNTASVNKSVTIVILAGGLSSRMGVDKGSLSLSDGTFAQIIIDLAKTITSKVIVSVGAHNQVQYKGLGIKTVLDTEPQKGPIGGVVSVLSHITTPLFLLLSVDSPLITSTMLMKLFQNIDEFDAAIFSYHDRIHPLVALYQTKTRNSWLKEFECGNYRITSIVKSFNTNEVIVDSAYGILLSNINTPKEYQELKELVR
jgi:molybdopterin-guanine dinucleotide biosynthesis protein A